MADFGGPSSDIRIPVGTSRGIHPVKYRDDFLARVGHFGKAMKDAGRETGMKGGQLHAARTFSAVARWAMAAARSRNSSATRRNSRTNSPTGSRLSLYDAD